MKPLIALLFLIGGLLHPATLQAAEGPLDHASLKTMIEGLGYEPQEGKFNDTQAQYYRIRIPGSPWNYDITIYIDASKNIVSINSEFALYKGAADLIPQSVLLGLLSDNANLTFTQFRYLQSSNSFFLLSNLRNKDVSAADLRRVIDEIVSAANRTQKLWDPKQWPQASTAEAAKPEPQATGDAKK
ncbi:MAG: hypothetical protein R3D51_03475 [Hyphomicrobiaceae bacterium]